MDMKKIGCFLKELRKGKNLEQEQAAKAGNTAFGLTFVLCAAMIVIQLMVFGNLLTVVGETLILLAGGAAYIGIMVHKGIWETGSRFRSTPLHDLLISVVCAGAFAVVLAFLYLRMGASASQTAYVALLFFTGISLVGFLVLRGLGYFSSKRKEAG